MSDRRVQILAFLEAHVSARLAELADHLGITRQGALRHLEALQDAGLVELATSERHGPGRPYHSYRLTPTASAHLPNQPKMLVDELVEYLQMDEMDRFFAARSARLEAEYAGRLGGFEGPERARELARLATASGHLTEVEEGPGGTIIRHHNCPIQDAATRGLLPCQHEQDMYGRLLGAKVEREGWLGRGDAACTYHITANEGTRIG
ncbi:MAG TPA: MarR family transcriptional regulator [Candidatus Acidoferrales bacterium]|nr:MarR family transcriptional regulator [Candidatus Acidoferrales bacterium]